MTRREMMMAVPMGAMAAAAGRRMVMQLDCGSIGVKATVPEALAHAVKHGFEAITADGGWLAGQGREKAAAFVAEMKGKGIRWGAAGLPLEFRKSEEEYAKGFEELKPKAKALGAAGVTRVSTWILPGHDSLTYVENLKQHAKRLRPVAQMLEAEGCHLGLEFVGPKTAWTAKRYPFVHTLREMRDLVGEIGVAGTGLLVDSWHWYTSGGDVAELQTLKASEVISIDMNDAPAGVALEAQVDSKRELPCATGVIPMADFLKTLAAAGCDAPARCEPFNAALRAMAPEEALAATAAAMKKAFALIG